MSTQANETAFPFQPTNDNYSNNYGLTKREYFAAMCLQGILASSTKADLIYSLEEVYPKIAVMYADELLKQLSQ